jgi:hypothetical protein
LSFEATLKARSTDPDDAATLTSLPISLIRKCALYESLVNDVGLGKEDCTLHFPSSLLFETSFLTDDTNVNLERNPF